MASCATIGRITSPDICATVAIEVAWDRRATNQLASAP
jgi:hypothetical protein